MGGSGTQWVGSGQGGCPAKPDRMSQPLQSTAIFVGVITSHDYLLYQWFGLNGLDMVLSLRWPSRYVLKRTAVTALLAAAISISISSGIRYLTGSEADTITVVVRFVLPFMIAIPLGIIWFSKLESLDMAYRSLLKQASELAYSASTDPLTGLLNRRSFADQFDLAMEHGIRGGFLIADVDYLKTINDEYGHLTGDDAIISTGFALKSALGEGSLIARIGGDEFCAFIPLRDGESAAELIARIEGLAGRQFRERIGKDEPVLSISCGYEVCRQGQTFRDMIAQTDSNLYRKKRARKNIARVSRKKWEADRVIS